MLTKSRVGTDKTQSKHKKNIICDNKTETNIK